MGDCSKTLPSKIFYEKFKHNESSLRACEKYKAILHSDYRDNEKVMQLCGKIVKFLRDNHSKGYKRNNTCKTCKLLNYWIYEQLDSTFSNDDKKNSMIFGNLENIWNKVIEDRKYSKDNICQLDSSIILDSKWKEKKEVYEICVDYKKINKAKESKNPQCEEYYSSIEKKLLPYVNYDKSLLQEKLRECSKNYKKRKKCDLTFDFKERIDKKAVLDTENQEQTGKTNKVMQNVRSILINQGGLGQSFSYRTGSVLLNTFVDSKDLPLVNSSNSIISSILSFIGTICIFYLWYKFTPHGAIIRDLKKKIKKLWNNRKRKKAEQELIDKQSSKGKSSSKRLFCIPYNTK
ncbi:PIR protein [Plasmodium ovale]|uniref:PIR Superfamily Protein n=2 Tax=Plasmodium ovale TaxID=36330 RepID=A0A1A8WKZ6_PLAOA|nr:PIR Superfamily Protein [Plasmodium ovale curtisi]SBS99733.1 PIR Superfamily Protein [Plasmodium ovale curtisi]SBT85419.1 PIR protein [Plasmodium ovale]